MFGDLFPIEAEILRKINETAKRLYAAEVASREWTQGFKEALRALGREHGFQVWGSFGDGKTSEWLWDLCWANCPGDKSNRPDDEWKNLRAIELACEIEWKQHDEWALEDFLKLLLRPVNVELVYIAA